MPEWLLMNYIFKGYVLKCAGLNSIHFVASYGPLASYRLYPNISKVLYEEKMVS